MMGEYKQSFCPECGFDVKVDEDGLCIGCGATAVGKEIDNLINHADLRKLEGKMSASLEMQPDSEYDKGHDAATKRWRILIMKMLEGK